MVTQKELKKHISYEKHTGLFKWERPTSQRVKKGDIVGSFHNNGYITIRLHTKLYLAHRLAWLYEYGEWPEQIDHINHNRKDNRLKNLRSVMHSENGKNQKMAKNNTSGITGVYWDKCRHKWATGIKIDFKTVGRKRFDNLIDAVCYRKGLEREYGFHGNHGT